MGEVVNMFSSRAGRAKNTPMRPTGAVTEEEASLGQNIIEALADSKAGNCLLVQKTLEHQKLRRMFGQDYLDRRAAADAKDEVFMRVDFLGIDLGD